MRPGHAFVLGSGIAGLALAEMLSRNGWTITLLETSNDLGGDASRCTQNWLHTGWLYAALPNQAAMLGCHQALRLYRPMYRHVAPPGALNLELDERGVTYPASANGWFSSEWVHFLYATATAELSLLQRMAWNRHLRYVAFRRLRALGYATTPRLDLSPDLVKLLNYWERSDTGHDKYTVVQSTDAQINTRRVLNTLLALLGEKAQVVRRAEYSLVKHGDRSTIQINGERHTPDLVVMATGKSIPGQLKQLGRANEASKFKSICSPIVVLDRALDLPNFIRFTPRLPETVNHIKYEISGLGSRSTLGSYDYYPAGEAPHITPFASRVCRRLDIPTSHVVSVYYGTKTEFSGSLARRYNHALQAVNTNTWFAIPGKFSQFPLLAWEFAERLGLRTDIANLARGTLRMEAAPTTPERCFETRRDELALGTA